MSRSTLFLGALVAAFGTFATCALLTAVMVLAFAAALLIDRFTGPVVSAEVAARHWERRIHVERFQPTVRTVPCSQTRSEALADLAIGHLPPRHGFPSHRPGPCRVQTVDWTPVDPLIASGVADPRRWPTLPPPCGTPELGCERETGRAETLSVTLAARGQGPFRCDVGEVPWNRLAVGRQVAVPLGAISGRPKCDEITP